ncbi:MAG: VWA domain-containing protein [Phycisphaerae bacterium]|nr:VWA domain-containing protein [Phycisphaerae bacterium]
MRFEFDWKWALLALLIVPVVGWLMTRSNSKSHLRFSTLHVVKTIKPSWRVRFRWFSIALRLACLTLLIIALARPQVGDSQSKVFTRGVAMELAIDRSLSMKEPMRYKGQSKTRLDVVKEVLRDFIAGNDNGLPGRENDLIGLVKYAMYADTLCPLSTNHDVLLGFLDSIDFAVERNEAGTAIGEGLMLAAARLHTAEKDIFNRNAQSKSTVDKDEKSQFEIKSKVIVLLTDGVNNRGEYSPLDAAKQAKEWGIKVYTIGIGDKNQSRSQFDIFAAMGQMQLDEDLLKKIARETGGFYARADSDEALLKICEKIDELEKTDIDSVEYSLYHEKYLPFAYGALGCLLLEILLNCTIFRKIP